MSGNFYEEKKEQFISDVKAEWNSFFDWEKTKKAFTPDFKSEDAKKLFDCFILIVAIIFFPITIVYLGWAIVTKALAKNEKAINPELSESESVSRAKAVTCSALGCSIPISFILVGAGFLALLLLL